MTVYAGAVVDGMRVARLDALTARARWYPGTDVDAGRGQHYLTRAATPWPWPAWAPVDHPTYRPDGTLPARLRGLDPELAVLAADRFAGRAVRALVLPAGVELGERDRVEVDTGDGAPVAVEVLAVAGGATAVRALVEVVTSTGGG